MLTSRPRPRSPFSTPDLTCLALIALASPAAAQELPRGIAMWNPDSLGNHRAVVHVTERAGAVDVVIPWRRPDRHPETRATIVIDARSGRRVHNVARIAIDRERGELVFQPISGPGDYHVYYLAYRMSGRSNYPKPAYLPPDSTADAAWLRAHGLDTPEGRRRARERLPTATATAIQAVDTLNRWGPMETIATGAEMQALRLKDPTPFLLFPEDRLHSIRMRSDLPARWIARGPTYRFATEARRGEYLTFQVGVWAWDALAALSWEASRFTSTAGDSLPAHVTAFNFEGVDWTGTDFSTTVSVPARTVQPLWFGIDIPPETPPGRYQGTVTIAAGTDRRSVSVTIDVRHESIANHGDDEPWRLSRLRWLNSRIALDDDVTGRFPPVERHGRTLRVLGRRIELDSLGLPARIASFFDPEMTHLTDHPREMLTGPIALDVSRDGTPVAWQAEPWAFDDRRGVVRWTGTLRAPPLALQVSGRLEFDGTMEYTLALSTERPVRLDDVSLRIPLARSIARYMLGMGRPGGRPPTRFDWAWDVKHNQEGAWIGDVNAGLQFTLRDDRYERPLNTNFYLSKPLTLPDSWNNRGRGGCHLEDDGVTTYTTTCFSGPRTLQAGEIQYFNVRLAITPFKPIDTDAQWSTRFYHRFTPLADIQALGANTVNVHHATDVNPWINYPFLAVDRLKAYVDEGHARGMKVKIYYTVRELTNRAPEVFALKSLGNEILSYGPGGGPPWLQEHLDGNYIPGWYVPRLKDAAIVNSGVSRWHNFYLEGLNWLVRHVGIDGLYIDDVAFDRDVMKRVRKVLDRGRPGALIDLHSANQFNVRDGFANSANLYLEHFPFIDRLWFGEYFDYDQSPDYWMTEVAGIPFGLMGEMLQDGGNPWRGMLYGMTARLPWAGDPTGLWAVWDDFGMDGSRMIGYWVPNPPVRTGRPDILATTWLRPGAALIAIGSWADRDAALDLAIDWNRLGLDPARTTLTAPPIPDFQPERQFRPGETVPIPAGRGWLLLLREAAPNP